MEKQKLIAVLGPTASGKTGLGESLAVKFNGEIISADAKQVYKGMDIGTAKEKRLKVPQHLIDIKEPGEKITVAEYQALAYQAIGAVAEKGKVPFLVGGSMLYVEAVTNGYLFAEDGKSSGQEPHYNVLKLGINLDREVLKGKAAARLRERVNQGLAEEVKGLLESGVSPDWLDSCGIEYRYFSRYALGQISLEEAISLTEIATNQYIKRQMTWWRRHDDIHWVQELEEAEVIAGKFIGS